MIRFLNRREWLRLGTLAGLGLTAPILRASERDRKYPGFGRAKSVILVYASGGQSQIDIWDMKPDAPEEVRGIFRPSGTAAPGMMFCEHLPMLGKVAKDFALVRNLSHDDVDHGSASYVALTGHLHPRKSSNPPPMPTDYPTYGSILDRVRPSKTLPCTTAHINGPAQVPEVPAPGQFSGFLGRAHEPLLFGDVTQEQIALQGLKPLPSLSPSRMAARRSLLEAVEEASRELENNPEALSMHASYQQAYDLLSSKKTREAMDLRKEPAKVRDRYGRNRSGQACLLARRLVEVGVPWITVIWNHTNRGQDKDPKDTGLYGWDTHNDIFMSLKDHLLPRFDLSLSALLEDLKQRGLLETTLVVCMGEFGRAPLVALEKNFKGSSPGRKHWAAAYSMIMAGAGVEGGQVIGATDRQGGYVKGAAYGPWDVAATMFSALGIDPAGHYTDLNGRPHRIADGKPMVALY